MSTLCSLLGKKGITWLQETEKEAAIWELVASIPGFSNKAWASDFTREVLRKEAIQSTGFGKGIAVAHGTCPQIETLTLALGISSSGIEFDALDNHPVHILFLIANPPETQPEYLSALSTLVRILRDEQFRQKILQCSNSREVYSLLERERCIIPLPA
jgi:nitrogen PTS system EIIA component